MAQGGTRIYKVSTPNGARLVKAQNNVQAIRFVAASTITAEIATQEDMYLLGQAGAPVEDASVDPADSGAAAPQS